MHALRLSIALATLLLLGCPRQHGDDFAMARPVREVGLADGASVEVSGNPPSSVVLLRPGKEPVPLVQLGKWSWTDPEWIRVSERGELLLIAVTSCSQLRRNDDESYRVEAFRSADGRRQRTVRLTRAEWRQLGLPECRHAPFG